MSNFIDSDTNNEYISGKLNMPLELVKILYLPSEVSHILSVPNTTITALMNSGKIPTDHIFGEPRISYLSLQSILDGEVTL